MRNVQGDAPQSPGRAAKEERKRSCVGLCLQMEIRHAMRPEKNVRVIYGVDFALMAVVWRL